MADGGLRGQMHHPPYGLGLVERHRLTVTDVEFVKAEAANTLETGQPILLQRWVEIIV